jgi:hypothetical protein
MSVLKVLEEHSKCRYHNPRQVLECQVSHVEDDNLTRLEIAVVINRQSKADVAAHEISFDAVVEIDIVRVVVEQLVDAYFVVFLCVLEQGNHIAAGWILKRL